MNLDWLNTVLPIINATGIPLLALGIVLLIKAYQKSVETYKDTTKHVQDENERLRRRLSEIETGYFSELERAREIASKSIEAIETLRIQKATALSEAGKESSPSDTKHIQQSIKMLKELSTTFKIFDIKLQEHIIYTQQEFNHLAGTFAGSLEKIANDLDDTSSKLTLTKIVNLIDDLDTTNIKQTIRTDFVYGEEKKMLLEEKRMLSAGKRMLLEKKFEYLEKMMSDGTFEEMDIMEFGQRLLGDISHLLTSPEAQEEVFTSEKTENELSEKENTTQLHETNHPALTDQKM